MILALLLGLGISGSILWFLVWLDQQHLAISRDVLDEFKAAKKSEDAVENMIKDKTKGV